MAKKKQKGSIIEQRVAPIILGALLVFVSLIIISATLFGQTGYVTEITRNERVGGRYEMGSNPNVYDWYVSYKFKTENGEIETGSVRVRGNDYSSKSGLRPGSPIRYLPFYPGYNTPGDGKFNVSTFLWLLTAAIGAWLISLGAKKGKP